MKDERLKRRLVQVVEGMGNNPNGSIPAASGDWAGAMGAYRFFANQKVTAGAILQPHRAETIRRVREEKVVLLVQDTTEVDLSRPEQQVAGAGPLDHSDRRGLLLHSLLAFSPEMKSLSPVQIWSAVPTPLTADFRIDEPSVERTVQAAIGDGMSGLFLAGTCGEGPWLPDRERLKLVKKAVQAAGGKLKIGAQVSDNSAPRILDNSRAVADAGADYAIIAAPATFMNATPDRVVALYREAAEACPLPVGIYDLGRHRPVSIPVDRLKEIYLLPNVKLVKDSSGSPERCAAALAARKEKPSLHLFNGDEFRCLEYLEAGYDGLMFGGAAAVGPQLRRIVELFFAARLPEAKAVEAEMKKTLFGIYGGESIACWLTGLKYYMVKRGLFATQTSFLGYPLTDECRAFIDNYAAASGR